MPEPLLEVRKLEAFYGDFQALFGYRFDVRPGEVVAMIGANGAGKSTLLEMHRRRCSSRRDAVMFDGKPIGDEPATRSSRAASRSCRKGAGCFPR